MHKRIRCSYLSKENIYLNICMISIVILIIIRDLVGLNINKMLYIGIVAIFSILLSSKNIVRLVCFLIPFLNGLPGNWMLLVIIFIISFKSDFNITMKKMIFPFLIFTSELMHSIFYIQSFSTVLEIVKYMTFVTILCMIIFDYGVEIEYEKCILTFVTSIIIMCAIILCVTLKFMPIENVLSGTFRYGDLSFLNLSGGMILSNNQNNIGYYCVLGIIMSLLLINKKIYNNFMMFIFILLLFSFGILTMSRAFILTSIVISMMYFVLTVKNISELVKNILYLLVSAISIYLLVKYTFPDVIDGIIERLTAIDGFGGRSTILSEYNTFLTSNIIYFIFGVGLFGIEIISKVDIAPHNGLQQILLSYGIIGIMILCVYLYMVIKSGKNNRTKSIIVYLPLIAMIIYTQSIQLLNPFELMLPLIPAWACIRSISNLK